MSFPSGYSSWFLPLLCVVTSCNVAEAAEVPTGKRWLILLLPVTVAVGILILMCVCCLKKKCRDPAEAEFAKMASSSTTPFPSHNSVLYRVVPTKGNDQHPAGCDDEFFTIDLSEENGPGVRDVNGSAHSVVSNEDNRKSKNDRETSLIAPCETTHIQIDQKYTLQSEKESEHIVKISDHHETSLTTSCEVEHYKINKKPSPQTENGSELTKLELPLHHLKNIVAAFPPNGIGDDVSSNDIFSIDTVMCVPNLGGRTGTLNATSEVGHYDLDNGEVQKGVNRPLCSVGSSEDDWKPTNCSLMVSWENVCTQIYQTYTPQTEKDSEHETSSTTSCQLKYSQVNKKLTPQTKNGSELSGDAKGELSLHRLKNFAAALLPNGIGDDVCSDNIFSMNTLSSNCCNLHNIDGTCDSNPGDETRDISATSQNDYSDYYDLDDDEDQKGMQGEQLTSIGHHCSVGSSEDERKSTNDHETSLMVSCETMHTKVDQKHTPQSENDSERDVKTPDHHEMSLTTSCEAKYSKVNKKPTPQAKNGAELSGYTKVKLTLHHLKNIAADFATNAMGDNVSSDNIFSMDTVKSNCANREKIGDNFVPNPDGKTRTASATSEGDYYDLDDDEVRKCMQREQGFSSKEALETTGGGISTPLKRTKSLKRPLPEITEPLEIVMDNELYSSL